MTLFQGKYRIESSRLKRFDYHRFGFYFVTIRIRNSDLPLSGFAGAELQLTPEGQIVKKCWDDLPNHYGKIMLDEYVIMPDHFHGIIKIVKTDHTYSHGLPEFIRAFKSFSSRRINELHRKKMDIWQPGYYDRYIRSDNALEAIRKYIRNNPREWINNS